MVGEGKRKGKVRDGGGKRWRRGGGRVGPQAKACPPRTIFLAPALTGPNSCNYASFHCKLYAQSREIH